MKIALLGDIAFFGRFSLENNENLHQYFKEVANKLRTYDLVIGNLETPFAQPHHRTFGYKSAYIKSSPVNVELLKYLNISVVNLANNHIYDYGPESYRFTKNILKENGIRYFGIEQQELLIETADNTIALNGYCCYSTNPLGIDSVNKKGINALSVPAVTERLTHNSAQGYFNIFSVHCGQEHVNYPNYDHIELARNLAQIGPYVFYGHHPHVLQGIEKINDSLLAYSLGNFCFDDVYTSKSKEPLIKQSQNNKESVILELSIEKNKLVDHKIVPITIGENSLKIGDENIIDKMDQYSVMLKTEKEPYIQNRNSLLGRYLASRKKLRNFNWYLQRLNHRSAGLILFARRNAKEYRKNISSYLK
ncbi:MAG: CapA family protein [Flavobacterium sp.]|nr:MAG: CapA family protein [Flavobacterium sp.]